MIVEIIKDSPPFGNLFLLHYSIKDKIDSVQRTCEKLKNIPASKVIAIFGGEPCPTNPLPKITIFNVENKTLMSAIQKIADHPCTPGSLIPLKEDEMKAYTEAIKTGDLITL